MCLCVATAGGITSNDDMICSNARYHREYECDQTAKEETMFN